MERLVTDQTQTDPAAVDTLRATITTLQAENARLLAESQTAGKGVSEAQSALAEALRERDAFKGQLAELAPKAKLADELQVKVEGLVNANRESAIVEVLRAKLPGADLITVKGVLSQLHDAGKASKFGEDAKAEADKVFALLPEVAPRLINPQANASGPAAIRPVVTPGAYRGPFSKK